MRRLVSVFAVAVITALAACGPEVPDEGEGDGGEGEAGEGEGDVVGEGEGDVVAEGEGDVVVGEGEGDVVVGEGEGDVVAGEGEGEPACVNNADCDLGFLCDVGSCVAGCLSDRDCPAPLSCDVALGDNGRCVECVDATDCNNGEICSNSQCRQGCAADGDCNGNDVCDLTAGICVQCNIDADCPTSTICTEQRCTLGCRSDRDCGNNETCNAAGLCVDACAADRDCPIGTTCSNSICTLGCNGDNARCGRNQVCGADNLCKASCNATPDCDTGFVCTDGACVPGDHPECVTNDDCGGFSLNRFCNDSGVCVGCLAQADCDAVGQFGLQCLADQQCHPSCNGQGACFGGQVCADDNSNACVDCNVDDECNTGEVCNAHLCEVAVATDPLCADCNQADDVCGAGNLCVNRQITSGFNGVRETACGIDCSDGSACPQAFSCELVVRQGVAVGAQCVPASRVVTAQTCVAVRDAREDAACVTNDDCGANNVDDGACVDGICSLPCAIDGDCFAGETCAPVIGSDVNACQ